MGTGTGRPPACSPKSDWGVGEGGGGGGRGGWGGVCQAGRDKAPALWCVGTKAFFLDVLGRLRVVSPGGEQACPGRLLEPCSATAFV